MPEETRSEQLLAEILETQRAHLDEYRRVTSESLDIQRQAVDTLVGGLLILALLVFVLWFSLSLF